MCSIVATGKVDSGGSFLRTLRNDAILFDDNCEDLRSKFIE